MKDSYLGEGVYASFDGYHVWLKTERDGQEHKIALEPDLIVQINLYFEKCWGKPSDTR